MESYDIEKLMQSSSINISKQGNKVNYKTLEQMKGDELLNCEVIIRNHQAEFYEGVIPKSTFSEPSRRGIGYHYRNVGVCASEEDSSALELISSAYGVSLCWNSEDRLVI